MIPRWGGWTIICVVLAFLFIALLFEVLNKTPYDVRVRAICAHHHGVSRIDSDVVICRDGYAKEP